ncbi:unnamed protein product, partial [Adineta steineri]
SDLEFITKCWRLKGRPIYVIMLRERHLRICVRLERLQTAISSACIEHLDFLNTSICPPTDWESVAVAEYRNTNDTGHYKSLTDVAKTPVLSEDIDYNDNV